jgi:hypothetical protein
MGRPRKADEHKTIHVGISFTPEDKNFLWRTYHRQSMTEAVRCAIQEARFWRAGKDPKTTPDAMPPPLFNPDRVEEGFPLESEIVDG